MFPIALASLLFSQPTVWIEQLSSDELQARLAQADVVARSAQAPEVETKLEILHGVIPKAVIAAAGDYLDLPMGAEVNVEVDGREYVMRLEPHYHPPGYVGGPTGWHKGVTVYVRTPVSDADVTSSDATTGSPRRARPTRGD
jgi:hypothetical protein